MLVSLVAFSTDLVLFYMEDYSYLGIYCSSRHKPSCILLWCEMSLISFSDWNMLNIVFFFFFCLFIQKGHCHWCMYSSWELDNYFPQPPLSRGGIPLAMYVQHMEFHLKKCFLNVVISGSWKVIWGTTWFFCVWRICARLCSFFTLLFLFCSNCHTKGCIGLQWGN